MVRANPESSMSLPKIAPSRKTGKYSFTKPAVLSMKRPVKIGATADGSVNKTAHCRDRREQDDTVLAISRNYEERERCNGDEKAQARNPPIHDCHEFNPVPRHGKSS